jgi:hypothetical protein
LALPNGLSGTNIGAALHWRTPLFGLMVGASDLKKQNWSSELTIGLAKGSMNVQAFNEWAVFGIYEKDKIMVASEYNRLNPPISMKLNGSAVPLAGVDNRQWYGMASYKLTGKLTAGIYDIQQINHGVPLSPERFSKDWVVSGRYDFNQYLCAKGEEHFISGTESLYDTHMNPNGLKLTTKLTILKIGVSF